MKKNVELSINEKMAMLKELKNVFRYLDEQTDGLGREWKWDGTYEDEPELDWRTGEVKHDEEGNEIHRKHYAYFDIPEDELDDETKDRIKALKNIQNYLEKLV